MFQMSMTSHLLKSIPYLLFKILEKFFNHKLNLITSNRECHGDKYFFIT